MSNQIKNRKNFSHKLSKILSVKVRDIFHKTVRTSWDLFKTMIPLLIAIKILQELNIMDYLLIPFVPIFEVLNIPTIYSLVWLVTILNTCYAAFPLLVAFFPDNPLNYAQLTALSLLVLVAHSLFVESAISAKLKINPYWIAGIRVFSGLLGAFLITKGSILFGVLQEPVDNIILDAKEIQTHFTMTIMDVIKSDNMSEYLTPWLVSIGNWAFLQVKVIIFISLVIFIVFILVQIIKDFNLANLFIGPISPLFRFVGIKKSNTFIVVICYIVGFSYGFGLLKDEVENNKEFSGDQSLVSITFISIAHSMIEDILIFAFFGANFWLLFLLRTFIGLLVAFIMVRLILPRIPMNLKKKIFYSRI